LDADDKGINLVLNIAVFLQEEHGESAKKSTARYCSGGLKSMHVWTAGYA
jgi:hypothetical protein